MAETNVLLGVCDEEIPEDAAVDYTVSKIGGVADCASHLKSPMCRVCSRALLQVVQLYCPLAGSRYHRTLHVFACTKKSCKNKNQSWMVLRAQRLDTSHVQPTAGKVMDWGVDCDEWDDDDSSDKHDAPTTRDWCDDADDRGENDDEEDKSVDFDCHQKNQISANQNNDEPVTEYTPDGNFAASAINQSAVTVDDSDAPMDYSQLFKASTESASVILSEEISKLNMNSASATVIETEPKFLSDTDTSLEQFVPHYLNVYEEPESSEPKNLKYEMKLLREYTQREGVDVHSLAEEMCRSDGARGGGEMYEKSTAKHGDRAFQKFMKKLSLCPQQCIRYNRKGQPLLMQGSVGHLRPAYCRHCGSLCVFEYQLMPALVNYLKSDKETDANIEFGTVIVYTCEKSCWNEGDTYREETVLLQSDPDEHLFK